MEGWVKRSGQLAFFLAALCVSVCGKGGEASRFFALTMSLLSEDPHLEGEAQRLRVRVTNPHDEPLSYLPSTDGFVGVRLSVQVYTGDEEVTPVQSYSYIPPLPLARPPFGQIFVRRALPGDSFEKTIPLWPFYKLGPGEYKVAARMVQDAGADLGLARGEVRSNEVSFAVRAWDVRERSVRECESRCGGKAFAALIRTLDDDVIGAWLESVDTRDGSSGASPLSSRELELEKVVRLARGVPLNRILWAADHRSFVAAIGDRIGEKDKVIVAHGSTSEVETFALTKRWPLGPDLGAADEKAVTGAAERTIPEEPETGTALGKDSAHQEPRGRASTGRLWARGPLHLVCGIALGAALSWLTSRFLTRRKRRAS